MKNAGKEVFTLLDASLINFSGFKFLIESANTVGAFENLFYSIS